MSEEQETHPLVRAVLKELRINPGFAELLAAALPKEFLMPAKKGTGKKKERSASQPSTGEKKKEQKKRTNQESKKSNPKKDTPLSLTSLFNREGEEALRELLKEKTATQLKSLVKNQQIPVDGAAFKGAPATLHDAVVAGVKFRIAERLAASS